jgi:hypothetical protein
MQAELEEAIAVHRPLAFAAGCLLAAWRQLPAHAEGRLTLASHVLAIGLMVPVAGLLLWGGLLGFPYLAFGAGGIADFLAGRSEQLPLLNVGDWAIAPALTLLVLGQAAGQLLLAWSLLKRDWARVGAISCFNAAALTTLIMVTSLLPIIRPTMLFGALALVVEMLAVLTVACSHERMLLS